MRRTTKITSTFAVCGAAALAIMVAGVTFASPRPACLVPTPHMQIDPKATRP